MEIKIKEEFKDTFIAFGGGGNLKLGERDQEDLIKLAIMGKKSGDKSILKVFDGELPKLEEMQASQTKESESKVIEPAKVIIEQPAKQVNKPV